MYAITFLCYFLANTCLGFDELPEELIKRYIAKYNIPVAHQLTKPPPISEQLKFAISILRFAFRNSPNGLDVSMLQRNYMDLYTNSGEPVPQLFIMAHVSAPFTERLHKILQAGLIDSWDDKSVIAMCAQLALIVHGTPEAGVQLLDTICIHPFELPGGQGPTYDIEMYTKAIGVWDTKSKRDKNPWMRTQVLQDFHSMGRDFKLPAGWTHADRNMCFTSKYFLTRTAFAEPSGCLTYLGQLYKGIYTLVSFLSVTYFSWRLNSFWLSFQIAFVLKGPKEAFKITKVRPSFEVSDKGLRDLASHSLARELGISTDSWTEIVAWLPANAQELIPGPDGFGNLEAASGGRDSAVFTSTGQFKGQARSKVGIISDTTLANLGQWVLDTLFKRPKFYVLFQKLGCLPTGRLTWVAVGGGPVYNIPADDAVSPPPLTQSTAAKLKPLEKSVAQVAKKVTSTEKAAETTERTIAAVEKAIGDLKSGGATEEMKEKARKQRQKEIKDRKDAIAREKEALDAEEAALKAAMVAAAIKSHEAALQSAREAAAKKRAQVDSATKALEEKKMELENAKKASAIEPTTAVIALEHEVVQAERHQSESEQGYITTVWKTLSRSKQTRILKIVEKETGTVEDAIDRTLSGSSKRRRRSVSLGEDSEEEEEEPTSRSNSRRRRAKKASKSRAESPGESMEM